MRFGRTLFAVLVAVGLAGCGSDGGISSPESAPLEFHDGFVRLDVPLSARYVEPAAGGKWVFVYGGDDTADGGRAFDDGAIYDVDAQQWSKVPDAPFDEPLWGPRAVWTGTEFVVIGTPCADPKIDSDNVDFVQCGDTQHVAAAFDPTSRRWRPVEAPSVRDLATTEAAIVAIPIGAERGRAVFLIEPHDRSALAHLYAIAPGVTPEAIPPLPVAQNRCALGDGLWAIGSGDTGRVPAPAGAIEPTNTWAYHDGTRVHDGGLGPTTGAAYGYIGGAVSCEPTAIGYVGLAGEGRSAGRGGEVDWFDPVAGWRRLPDLPPLAGATDALVAETGATPIVWVGDRITLLREGAWDVRSAAGYEAHFPSSRPKTLAAAGRYLVGRPLVDAPDHPVLVLVDPDALPPAA